MQVVESCWFLPRHQLRSFAVSRIADGIFLNACDVIYMPAILKIIELAHMCRYLPNIGVQWSVPFFRTSDLRSVLLTDVFSSLPCVTSWAAPESWPQPLPSLSPIPSSSHEALPHFDARYVIPDPPHSLVCSSQFCCFAEQFLC